MSKQTYRIMTPESNKNSYALTMISEIISLLLFNASFVSLCKMINKHNVLSVRQKQKLPVYQSSDIMLLPQDVIIIV